MNVISWRAYYWTNEETIKEYTSSQYNIEDLPKDNMLGVVQYYDECVSCDSRRHYRGLVHGADWYLWDGAKWTSVPSHPIKNRWVQREDVEKIHPNKVLIKSAPQLTDSEWQVIMGMLRDAVEAP